jgi:CBS domain-containing protein
LLISGSSGALIGELAIKLFPGSHLSAGAFALVAMAATFGAATRATFTAIVFLFELTRDYHAILPLMIASVIADLIAGVLLRDSIMTEKLARRGLSVHHEYEVDVLRSKHVRDVMTTEVETLPASATVAEADRAFMARGHGAFPLIEGGRCVGVIARADLMTEDFDPSMTLADAASPRVITVDASDLLIAALELILEEEVDHLPVIDEDGRLVGMCTKTDILRARIERFALERAEPGWRPRRRTVD